MTDRADVQGLNQAVQRYFDLMYDFDTSRSIACFARPPNCTDFAEAK